METENEHRNGFFDSDEGKVQTDRPKVFNDPIHGHIELHPLCIKIIDTPEFQRLRNIKQLGTCYLVYPGASHNRFEHSLGVCHLAGKLLRAIKVRQPIDENGLELMTEKDILCVEIAGLCHDLGHGPFSHLFDQKFIPSILPGRNWKHEKASVKMFDYILDKNGGQIKKEFENLMHDFREEDLTFIKELIDVPLLLDDGTWPYEGRGKNKSFLYEVVANKTNGIDVDKWDYFARDSYMLGMKNSFDHNRCISSAKVLEADGRRQICYRDKEAHNLYDMFHTRMMLHRRAYQHKTHNIIGSMMCDALVAADNYLKFELKNGRKLKMSEAIDDMEVYAKLTDTVILKILRTSEEPLKKSREILSDIINRKLYKFVGQTQRKLTDGPEFDSKDLKRFIILQARKTKDSKNLSENNLVIDVVKFDYGMKNKDPIMNVRFYSKENTNTAIVIRKAQVSHFLPDTFAEQYIRLYCKFTDKELIEVIKDAFSDWCRQNSCENPQGDVTTDDNTEVIGEE